MVDVKRMAAVLTATDEPPCAELVAIRAHWDDLRGEGAFPPRESLDPVAIRHFLPHVALVDVLAAPLDFRYRLMGEAMIAENARSLKGRTVLELLKDDPEQQGLFDTYSRVAAGGRPIYAQVEYENVRGALKTASMGVFPLGSPPAVTSLLIGIFYFF